MEKSEKEGYFIEHQDYIKKIVARFLMIYPSYGYMREDMVGSCNLRFLIILDKFDEKKAKMTTFIWDQLWYWLQKELARETKLKMGEEAYAIEYGSGAGIPKDDKYKRDFFEELLLAGACTPMQAEILRCRYIAGMTYEEVGVALGSSKQAVQQAESRALKKLRDRL